jgi:hypothetical protein
MSRLRRTLPRPVLALLLIGAFVAGTTLGPTVVSAASTAIQNVLVTNTAANPVPVAGTVNVGNLPATQPVSGSVGITGTPTVNVGNIPEVRLTGTFNHVIPDKDPRDPLPVYDPATRKEHPFSIRVTSQIVDGSPYGSDRCYTAPANKRFVIEHVSAQAYVPTGQSLSTVDLMTEQSDFLVVLMEHGGRDGNVGTHDVWNGNEVARLFVEPGDWLDCRATREATTLDAQFSFQLTGQLVDVP